MKTRHQYGQRAALEGSAPFARGPSAAAARVKAFTLIETLVAMGVVGIMVGVLYTAITLGFSSIRTSRENLRATQIMVEKMEVIRLLNWDQAVVTNVLPATFVAYYDPIGATNGKGPGVTYTGTIEVKQFPTAKTYQPEMREVTVQVDWVTGGLKHSRKLKSHVAHYGIQNYVYN